MALHYDHQRETHCNPVSVLMQLGNFRTNPTTYEHIPIKQQTVRQPISETPQANTILPHQSTCCDDDQHHQQHHHQQQQQH